MSSGLTRFSSRHSFSVHARPPGTGRARRTAQRSPASVDGLPPVVTDMGLPEQIHRTQRLPRWDDLDAVEQSLLVVASQERTLANACASWSPSPRRRTEIEHTRSAAARLLHRGLIGFYRVDDGYPDLSESDVDTVLRGYTHWDCGHTDAGIVGLFLTTAGEDLVLGP